MGENGTIEFSEQLESIFTPVNFGILAYLLYTFLNCNRTTSPYWHVLFKI